MAKLGDIATYVNGFAFKPSDWSNEGLPIIRIQDLTGNSYQANRYNGSYHPKYEVNDGDVLISWSASLGVYVWKGEKAVLNQHIFKVVFDKSEVDKNFFVHQVQNILENAASEAHGATMKHLTKPVFDALPFYLPNIEKQKEIASVLDKVTELIALRKEQFAKLDQLVKSRFIELFGEVETNVKGFPMKRMDECCKFIGGAQPDKSHFEYEKTDDNIRLIQIRDYKSDRFITYIPKSLARKTCTASDIMIGRYGPPIFQILGGIEGAYNVALMKAVPTAEFNTEFFRNFLKSEKLLHYLESFSQRTAGQDGIQIDKLNAYPCFVPPMELQIQFAAFVEQTDKSKLAIQQSLDKLELLKNSLMQEYFG